MARKTKVQEELEKEKMAKIRAQANYRAQKKYIEALENIARQPRSRN